MLLTSHYLEEVQVLAQRVVVIDRGRVLVDDSLDAVRAMVDVRRVSLRVMDPLLLDGLEGVSSSATVAGRTDLLTTDSDQLVRDIVRRGVPFADLEVSGTSLEEAFLALTTRSRTTSGQLR